MKKKDFTYLLRVRYSECDAQKVVFNGKYIDYIDIAYNEFMRAIWTNYNDIIASGVDNQVVNINIGWHSSAYFDDVVAINVKTIHIGTTSYTLHLDFSNHKDSTKIASAEIVYVLVDAKTFKKMEIPKNLRQKLEKGAPQVICNHAGKTNGE